MTEVIAVEEGSGPSYGPAVPLRPDPSPQKAVPSFTEVGQLLATLLEKRVLSTLRLL
jgi:hypothetical protein